MLLSCSVLAVEEVLLEGAAQFEAEGGVADIGGSGARLLHGVERAVEPEGEVVAEIGG